MAAARPMPESAPVTRALQSASLPEPLSLVSPWLGLVYTWGKTRDGLGLSREGRLGILLAGPASSGGLRESGRSRDWRAIPTTDRYGNPPCWPQVSMSAHRIGACSPEWPMPLGSLHAPDAGAVIHLKARNAPALTVTARLRASQRPRRAEIEWSRSFYDNRSALGPLGSRAWLVPLQVPDFPRSWR